MSNKDADFGVTNYRGIESNSGKDVLKITSFNCRGLKSSSDDLKLFKSTDILAIQEHWLNPAEFWLFNQVGSNVSFSAVSPMERNKIYSGRPFGGVALLWHNDLQEMVQIKSGSSRIAAAVLSQVGRRVLIVSIYMPVDYGDPESFAEFMEQLGDLDGILSSVSFNSCICIGDFNADLWNASSRRYSKLLNHLCVIMECALVMEMVNVLTQNVLGFLEIFETPRRLTILL